MFTRATYGLIISLLLVMSCNRKNTAHNEAVNNPLEKFKNETNLVVNFSINKSKIISLIEGLLDQQLKNPITFDKYKITANVTRIGTLDMSVNNKDILFEIPLDIQLTKPTILGDIKANGSAMFVVSSKIEINNEWTLTTQSNLEYHEWIIMPSFDVGINIPAIFVTDILIDKVKPLILDQLDNSIQDNVQIKESITKAYESLTTPFHINSQYSGWYQLRILEIGLGNIHTNQNNVNGQLYALTENEIHTNVPKITDGNLPSFNWKEPKSDSSFISVGLNLTDSYIEETLNRVYKGITFSDEEKSITIKTIKVTSEKRKLSVNVSVFGDYSGWIKIRGIPSYNNDLKTIEVENIDVNVKTKNVLAKGISWLFKGKMKRNLKKILVIPVNQYVEDIQDHIDVTLAKLNQEKGFYLYTKIGSYDLNDIEVYRGGLIGVIQFNAYLSSHFDSISPIKH